MAAVAAPLVEHRRGGPEELDLRVHDLQQRIDVAGGEGVEQAPHQARVPVAGRLLPEHPRPSIPKRLGGSDRPRLRPSPPGKAAGAMGRLRRVDCSEPGIQRRRRGRGFEFLLPDGSRLDDEETLARIRELAIPPAWKDVWICMHPRGHLQATGVDAAGRKQYLYHADWRTRRDQQKFDEMLEFAEALPKLRRVVRRDLAADGAGA